MVLDTLAKLEKEKLTITHKLEMDQKGEFPWTWPVSCWGRKWPCT
jgi:hypothetical protein